MRSVWFRRIFASLLLSSSGMYGQQKINPNTGISWPLATGIGAPISNCASSNYGQPYTDTAAGTQYVCSSTGWVISGGGTGPSIGLSTNGTNGPATLKGSVLNVPQYAGAPSGFAFDVFGVGDSI